MKSYFQKIVSFLMAIVLLLSTISFTVSIHYCGDTLIDTAIFVQADSCGTNLIASSSDNKEIKKKNCCRNEVHFVDGNDAEQFATQKMELPNVYFVAAFISNFQNLSFLAFTENPFKNYKPPLVKKDITALFENFRI